VSTAIIPITVREVLDSHGNPTVEVDVTLASGPRSSQRTRTSNHEPTGSAGVKMQPFLYSAGVANFQYARSLLLRLEEARKALNPCPPATSKFPPALDNTPNPYS
jgi:hypothetical protein